MKEETEQFKAQEQGYSLEDVRNMINMCLDQLNQPFEGRDDFINELICHYPEKPKAQEQKPITNEEIEALAENIPKELGWSNDGTAEPNDIKRAFIKGFKAALNHK